MKKISKIAFLMVLAASAAFGTVSCRQSDLEKGQTITENQPATLKLNIDGANFSSVATRAATTESEIHSLALFVFTSSGKLLTRSLIEEAQTSQINVKTSSGKNMRVIAVANYKAVEGLEEQLVTAANYDVLTDIVVTHSATSPGSSAGILMTGETVADITDSPSGTSIALTMKYAVVKVTLSIKVNSAALPAGETIDIVGLKLGSIAQQGFLMSKTEEPGERIYTDIDSISYSGNQNDGITATFYILENLRGGRKQIAHPNGMIEDGGNGHLFKRHFAPDNSSYAVISANHRKNGSGNKRVDMYVYFGHNSSNNYDIARSESHTYTIRINGLNNINIDTNIEAAHYDFELGYGDNLRMDAHADSRPLSFAQGSGSIDVEVVDANGRRFSDAGFDATWVKISPLDLMKHQVRAQKGNGSKGEWQQTGERNAIVRGKYIPHHSIRAQHPKGGWNEIPSGKDNDDKLSLADATYRMCYAITDITLTENREIIIYADENMTSNERSAKIKVSFHDETGVEQSEILTISQVPMLSVGTADSYELMIESFEEYSFNTYATPQAQLTKTNGMHWGFYNHQLYNGEDGVLSGNFLTANAVYGHAEDKWKANNYLFVQHDPKGNPTWSAGISYRSKYGANSLTTPWDSRNGQIVAPYHYPDYNVSAQTYAPIYNSAAARYCHEKNRDLNGDGEISSDETTWYLPSSKEISAIAQMIDKLPVSVRPNAGMGYAYWTSTEGTDTDIAYAYDFESNGIIKSKKNTTNKVRCIRRGKQVDNEYVYVNPDNSVVVDNSTLQPEHITETPKSLIPTTENSDKTIGSKFIVARHDAVQRSSWTNAAGMTDIFIPLQLGDNLWSDKASGCATYSELDNGSDKGKWRLPTKGELSRISELLPKLEAIAGFTPFANTWYWSATETPNYNVYNSWAVNPTNNSNQSFGRATLNNARCIKQI